MIWSVLEPIVFEPLTEDTWLRVAAEFEVMWDVPHCVGSLDGKHVRIQVIINNIIVIQLRSMGYAL